MQNFPEKFLIFGCGNMAGAMLKGWLASGVDPSCFTVVDPVARDLPAAVTHFTDASGLSEQFDQILLGIKPQLLAQLAPAIAPMAHERATFFSILAGARCDTIGQYFPGCDIIRLMPNLAAAIGKSPIGCWSNTAVDHGAVAGMLAPLGKAVWLSSEEQMDAVTALSGSGPAFIYRFIDALGKAGEACGLDPAMAALLAKYMAEGASALAAQSTENPAQLAARVTSPGGTTAAGLAVLDESGALNRLVQATLAAATQRGKTLAELAEKPND